MLLQDYAIARGDLFFRWRSYVLLLFTPFVAQSIMNGEPVAKVWGETVEFFYNGFAIVLVILGQVIRILTIGFVREDTSSRSTKGQIASRLNTTGMYAITRNPLYLGNCLSVIGILLYPQNLYLALTACLFLTIYYGAIILAEENFLHGKFGQDYAEWAGRVNAFLPGLTSWKKPELPFSWRFVLRREHSSWFAVFMPLFLIAAGQQYVKDGSPPASAWLAALGVMTAIYAGLYATKKRTGLLNDLRFK